jgi:hypothetical protein
MQNVNPERKVTVASRIPSDLADAVAQLADAGDRTMSREIFRAIRDHVDRSGGFSSSHPPNPAERGETSGGVRQSNSPAPAGPEGERA